MSRTRFSLPRTIPMPLWLQGITESVITGALSLALMLLMMVVGWLSLDTGSGLLSVLPVSGQGWLVAQGVPLNFTIPAGTTYPAAAGTLTLTPLGMTLLLLWLDRKAGRRLAQASYEGQFWQPVLGAVLARAGLGLLICWASATPHSAGYLWAAGLGPALVALVGLAWGGHSISQSWLRLLGTDRAQLAADRDQRVQWAGLYAAAVVRAVLVVVCALIMVGALLAGISTFWHWDDILATQQSLHAGMMGDITLTLVHLALLPNFAIWAAAWAVGAGFLLGEGSTVSPAATEVSILPSLPLLQALPPEPGPYAFAVLILPVLAGVGGAWWFLREGENHLDDWFRLRIPVHWLAAALSALVFAALLGASSGLAMGALGWLSAGSLGAVGFGMVGPSFGSLWIWTSVTVAIGALIGQIIGPVIERDEQAVEFARAQRARRQEEAAARREKARQRKLERSSAGTTSPHQQDASGAESSEESLEPSESPELSEPAEQIADQPREDSPLEEAPSSDPVSNQTEPSAAEAAEASAEQESTEDLEQLTPLQRLRRAKTEEHRREERSSDQSAPNLPWGHGR